MTDEERQQLCERLRRLDLERDVGIKAADEIERLAEALKAGNVTIKAGSEIEQLVQERKIERLMQERDSALTTLKAHGIMK
jgi:ASC-1-like (ASCH) protein